MGFWGTFVVHRGERLLWELLPDVSALNDAELCHDRVSGGWQVTRVFAGFDRLPADFLTGLRDMTGAPVLAAEVMDSDAALVKALGRHTPGWQAWLRPDAAIGYLAPPPAPFAEDGSYLGDDWRDPEYEREARLVKERILAETPGGAVAAPAGRSWAGEAGLAPGSVEEVAEALDGHDVFVEDVFFTLLNRLGLNTEEVARPSPPALVDVLRGQFGHRLDSVDMAPHRPVRGERLAFSDMLDLRLHFEGQQTLTACSCGGVFVLLPEGNRDDGGSIANAQAVAEVAGRQLTDAATVRHRFLPFVRGVMLRFGDRDLFIVALDGRWTVANGAQPPHDEIHVNPWLAS